MSWREPEMQGKECGLGEEAHGHERGRNLGGRVGADLARQEHDIERAVATVEERAPEQIEHGAEQREEEIAERGGERLRAAVQAHQRHRSKGEELQRDVEIEEIVADE